MRRVGGTPIEEAPFWALALFTGVLWLVVFPALVGLLNGLKLVAGGGWTLAGLAALVSLLLTAGLARQRPWKRPDPGDPFARPPLFVRFSSWLVTALFVPNVLYGVLVLSRGGEGLDYASAWLIGLLASAIHGAFALAAKLRRK